MQKTHPAATLPVQALEAEHESLPATVENQASRWVSRITGILGGISLLIALSVWFARHGHYRLVLAFLVIAMFMSILHAYTFESAGDGG